MSSFLLTSTRVSSIFSTYGKESLLQYYGSGKPNKEIQDPRYQPEQAAKSTLRRSHPRPSQEIRENTEITYL